jgi:hypothetical protein
MVLRLEKQMLCDALWRPACIEQQYEMNFRFKDRA